MSSRFKVRNRMCKVLFPTSALVLCFRSEVRLKGADLVVFTNPEGYLGQFAGYVPQASQNP